MVAAQTLTCKRNHRHVLSLGCGLVELIGDEGPYCQSDRGGDLAYAELS